MIVLEPEVLEVQVSSKEADGSRDRMWLECMAAGCRSSLSGLKQDGFDRAVVRRAYAYALTFAWTKSVMGAKKVLKTWSAVRRHMKVFCSVNESVAHILS